MIKRVAWAICDAGMAWLQEMDAKRQNLEWADVPDEVFARAAVEAMREPTGEMVVAIEAKAEERYRAAPDMQRFYGDDLWRAGIDEALK